MSDAECKIDKLTINRKERNPFIVQMSESGKHLPKNKVY